MSSCPHRCRYCEATWKMMKLEAVSEVSRGGALMRSVVVFVSSWGIRTQDGYKIKVDVGLPDSDGVYEPVFTVDHSDNLADLVLRRLRDLWR